MEQITSQVSADVKLSAEDIEKFNQGLKMGMAVGNVVGAFAALTVSVALPVVPWAVGTAVMAKKGWEYGAKAGAATMAYKGTRDMQKKYAQQ